MQKVIDALTIWAEDPASFRRDVATFLSLSQEAIDTLVATIEEHATFLIPASEIYNFEMKYDLNDKGRGILAAAGLIRSYVMQYDPQERAQYMAELADSVDAESFLPERFSRFLSWLPKLDTETLNDAAIHVGPTLIAVDMRCDLRVVSNTPNADWHLVPVLVVRLTFDEPVGGQDALFVQLTEEIVEDLEIEIESARATLRNIQRRYGNDILLGKKER